MQLNIIHVYVRMRILPLLLCQLQRGGDEVTDYPLEQHYTIHRGVTEYFHCSGLVAKTLKCIGYLRTFAR